MGRRVIPVRDVVAGWPDDDDRSATTNLDLPLPEDPRAAFTAWEAAVGDLVATAVTRTGSDEHWYGNSGRVLSWFLGAAGVPDHLCGAMVEDAIGGRFQSWTGNGVHGQAGAACRRALRALSGMR
jgi:hypothetical protein